MFIYMHVSAEMVDKFACVYIFVTHIIHNNSFWKENYHYPNFNPLYLVQIHHVIEKKNSNIILVYC